MIKATIICLIIAIVTRFIMKVMAGSMSVDESIRFQFHNELPFRMEIAAVLFCISSALTVIFGIITILSW